MNIFILLALCISGALCAPVDEATVQFAEDTLGNYKLSYKTLNSSKIEERTQDGKVVGSFTFLDGAGVKHTVSYVAGGEEGFKAIGADIPVPVADTRDVIKSKSLHFALVDYEKTVNPPSEIEEEPVPVNQVLAKLILPEISSLPAAAVPEEDSDIIAAKTEFLAAYARDLKRLAEEYKKRV